MQHDKGSYASQWRPSPKFILRRDVVRHVSRSWGPGRFLEAGAGTGTMSRVFLDAGYTGVCFDVADTTLATLSANLSEYVGKVQIVGSINQCEEGSFDYLFAFEVLEHIEDDHDVLRSWTTKLQVGGRLLISVPAHRRKYSGEDRFVGHFRRYDKSDVEALLRSAGYQDIRVYNYGFPLGNITGFLSRTFRLSGRSRDGLDLQQRSIRSGVQRGAAVQLLGRVYNDQMLYPFCLLQRAFLSRDIGDGYIATAIKS